MHKATSKFFSDQIIVSVSKQEYLVEDMPFPAVTICPDVIIPENLSLLEIKAHEKLYLICREENIKCQSF